MLQPISTRIFQAGLINHLQGNGAELELPPAATFLRRDRSQLGPGHAARRRLGQSIRTDPARPQSTPPRIMGTIFRGLGSNAAAQTVANVSLATQAPCPTHGPARCRGNPVAAQPGGQPRPRGHSEHGPPSSHRSRLTLCYTHLLRHRTAVLRVTTRVLTGMRGDADSLQCHNPGPGQAT